MGIYTINKNNIRLYTISVTLLRKIMTEWFSNEEKAKFKVAFEMFDENKDGTIDINELNGVMKSLGQKLRSKELKRMIAEVDANRNGKIDLEEFYILMGRKYDNNDKEAEMRAAFLKFDTDGNGYITKSELKKAMKELGEKLSKEELADMMNEADIDGDNKVSFEEFIVMMQGT